MARKCCIVAWVVLLGLLVSAAAPARADKAADIEKFNRDLKELKADDLKGLIQLFKWCLQKQLFEQVEQVGDMIIACKDLSVREYKLLAAQYCRAQKPDVEGVERKLLLELSGGFKAMGSNHYLILYDGEPDFAKGRAEWLEKGVLNFYLVMPEIGVFPRFLSHRLVAIVFDDGKGYNQYAVQRGVPPYVTSGFYSMLDNRLAIYDEKEGPGYQAAQGEVRMLQASVKEMAAELADIPGGDQTEVAARIGSRIIHTTKGKLRADLKKEYVRLEAKKAAFVKLANSLNVAKTLHEGAHQLAYNLGVQKRLSPYPRWVSEGLATVFETAGDATGWGPRRVNPDRCKLLQKLIKDGKARSALQLAGMSDDNFKDGQDVLNFYAESYGLFFYLLRFEEDKLRDYLRDLRGRESETLTIDFEPGKTNMHEIEKKLDALYDKWKDKEVDLFEKHFGKDLDDLTKKWYHFIEGLSVR